MRLVRLLIMSCFLIGCAAQSASPTVTKESSMPVEVAEVRTDLDGLAAFISLPAQPTSVQWTTTILNPNTDRSVPGPTDMQIEAVMSFAAADLEQLKAQAQPLGWTVQWKESTFKPWHPQSVRDAFEADGDVFKLTVPVYDAIPVFSPSQAGSFFVTPAGDVFLSIATN